MSENPVGNSFSNVAASTTVTAVIAPASNTKGAIVRTASVNVSTGGTTVWTGPTAPSSHTDNKPVPFFASGNTNQYQAHHMPYPLSLPAGFGLWVTSSSGALGNSSFTFDLIG